jgi:aromatic-L-amino-acid decarboxylase
LKGSNELNKALEDRLNSSGKLYIIHTVIRGEYVLRMSIGTATTQPSHVQEAWKLIQLESQKLLDEKNA